MNYQRATRLAEKARQEADLARQNRQNAEGQLVTAQRALDAAQAEQARAEAADPALPPAIGRDGDSDGTVLATGTPSWVWPPKIASTPRTRPAIFRST